MKTDVNNVNEISENEVKAKIHSLITVEQLPKITERLKSFKVEIDQRVSYITSLNVNNDNYKQIKKELALLRKFYTELESSRKEVKKQVLSPYNDFEQIYKQLAQNPLNSAISEVSTKINEIEIELKKEKEEKVKAYFDEYAQKVGVDFVTFEQAGINITMTASLKSLKDEAKRFIDKSFDDVKLIALQEHKDEIMVEYKQNHNASLAIITVKNRYKAIEREHMISEKKEQQHNIQTAEVNAVAEAYGQSKPEEIITPCGEQENTKCSDEKIYHLHFDVYGTKEQLSEFAKITKTYLNERGMKYE